MVTLYAAVDLSRKQVATRGGGEVRPICKIPGRMFVRRDRSAHEEKGGRANAGIGPTLSKRRKTKETRRVC